jgi:hypothetical protein
MPQYMLVLRDSEWDPSSFSPEELQAVFEKYGAWSARMGGTGNKLRDDQGRVLVRNGNGVTVTDGPYAEAKEILGGYMIVEADSYDDVVRHCQDSPHLQFGSIEIREVERM